MGKRELLLAAAFVVVGFAVYQVTAPPADPAKPGFSLSGVMDEVRREIGGQRASAETKDTTTVPLGAFVKELRLTSRSGTVTVSGEDRTDIEAELHVRSTGYDTAEASRLAKETRLTLDEAGPALILDITRPQGGRQIVTLSLKVPSRLALRMDGKGGPLEVENIASVTLGTARGDTTISGVSGAVSLEQRGNRVTVTDVGSLRLRTMGRVEARVSNVEGDTILNLQGGEFHLERLAGAIEVDARNAEVRFEQLEKLRGPIRVNALSGEVTFVGLATEAQIEGRNTEIRVAQAAAVPLAIYNTNDTIELTVPAEGFTLDALSTGGRVSLDATLEKSGLTVRTPEEADGTTREMRVSGNANGGGPTITLRATRGDIVLRSR